MSFKAAATGLQRPRSVPLPRSIHTSCQLPTHFRSVLIRRAHVGSGSATGRCRALLPPLRAASAPDAPTVDTSTTGTDTDSSSTSSSAPRVLLTGYAADSGALPDVLAATFPERFPTLSAARKVIRRGEVLVDGVVGDCGSQVPRGAGLAQVQLEERRKGRGPRVVELKVVYEDEDMAVVVKPWGVKVYGGDSRRTITGALTAGVLAPSSKPDALARPTPVHRLDAAVGGLLVVGKTRSAVVALTESFSKRRVSKTYLALLCGQLEPRDLKLEAEEEGKDGLSLALSTTERSEEEEEGSSSDEEEEGEGPAATEEIKGAGVDTTGKTFKIKVPLNGKKATTKYILVGYSRSPRYGGWLSSVALSPITGRKHQLRRHMAALGHPIVGDGKYTTNPEEHIGNQGLYLEAVALALPHPVTGEPLEVSLPEPERFQRLRGQQESGWLKAQRAAAWHAQQAAAAAAAGQVEA